VHDLSGVPGAPADVAGCAAISSAALKKFAKAALATKPKPLAKLTLLAPIPRPARNVFCVGKNYHEHAKEFAQSGFDSTAKEVVPEAPVVFTKPPSAVSGPGDVIPASLDDTKSVDYEGELAVVIGKGGRGIAKADALKHVFGYTIVNDVTSRKLQQLHRQWVLPDGSLHHHSRRDP
jgi:2-keto-4-pentenoate hydratase/2-oxohepta-3-ene-1,7-dioic acid hydratase in catechol pathway